jgi:transcriptional regulator with XRE-family HTH domain
MNIDNNEVGRTIRRLRKSKKLTQDVLSGLAGIARSHLSMIETGTKSPNFQTLCKIAAALELSPSALVMCIEETAADFPSEE